MISASHKKSLFDLFAENSPLVAGADLTGATSGDVSGNVREHHEELVSDNLFFKIKMPHPLLRRYLAYMLNRLIDEDDDVTLDIESLGNLQVPLNLDAVVGAIDLMLNSDPLRSFQEALLALDGVVAGLFGMSPQDLAYIISAMTTDGFLKQLRPSFEHRGLRIQPYADHSQSDRYA